MKISTIGEIEERKKKSTFFKISNKHPYQSCAIHNGQEIGATQVSVDCVSKPFSTPTLCAVDQCSHFHVMRVSFWVYYSTIIQNST